MATIVSFEEMQVWQRARLLNQDIYRLFKDSKDLSFRDQIFQASVSIMNNIAEGFERKSDREFHNFLNIAKGSSGEVRSMLYLALDFGYISEKQRLECANQCLEISKMLSAFMKHLQGIK